MTPRTLRELNGRLIVLTDDKGSNRPVMFVAEADGIRFLCPLCFETNGGPVGTHQVICWKHTVPDHIRPGPGRWSLDGVTINDVTVNEAPGKTRSVLLLGGCAWHGFVTNGVAT